MEVFLQRMKPLVVTLLALIAAIAVTIGAIQLRAWWGMMHGSGPGSTATTVADKQKLAVLASLKASSTPSVSQQSKILHALSGTSSQSMSEQTKLNMLKALQKK